MIHSYRKTNKTDQIIHDSPHVVRYIVVSRLLVGEYLVYRNFWREEKFRLDVFVRWVILTSFKNTHFALVASYIHHQDWYSINKKVARLTIYESDESASLVLLIQTHLWHIDNKYCPECFRDFQVISSTQWFATQIVEIKFGGTTSALRNPYCSAPCFQFSIGDYRIWTWSKRIEDLVDLLSIFVVHRIIIYVGQCTWNPSVICDW